MPRAKPLPPELRDRAFSAAEARKHSVGQERLRRADLRAPFHGVRESADAPITLRGLCRAFAARGMAGQVFSHATAARLFRMPLPYRLESTTVLHVSSIGTAREPRMRGIVGHRIDLADVSLGIREGFLVPSAVDTWCQLATLLTVDELVVVGDFILGCEALDREALASLSELAVAVGRMAGRRGAKRLREALQCIREGSASALETKVRLLFERAGLPAMELNGAIRDAHGKIIALGDLLLRAYKVDVEVEGDQHFSDKKQWSRDLDRLNAIAAEGYVIVRISGDHVRDDPDAAVGRVRAALVGRGWVP